MTSSVNAVEDARPNARDRQALEDRVGQDERRADHRRRGGQEDRLETGRSRLDQRRTEDDALGETAVVARATKLVDGLDRRDDRLAVGDVGRMNDVALLGEGGVDAKTCKQ